MIFAEVGLNHIGKINYSKKYINFHKYNNFEVLIFQIREPEFYLREEKKHLKLPLSFYKQLSETYKKEKHKKVGISLSSLRTFNQIKKFKFNYYKILSIAAKNERLIRNILKFSKAKIYISCGMLNFKELKKIVLKYKNNKRIKFIYTQLSYNKNDLNLINLFNLKEKYQSKFSYGHHYVNKIPILLTQIFKNIDLFIYIKGEKKIKHPDEKHALNFKKFQKLLLELKEIKSIMGNKNKLTAKNTIPDQKNEK